MRRKFLPIAALGLALLSAPGAFAASPPAAVDCRLLNFAEQNVTGGQDTFTGTALGYVVAGTPGDNVTIRCYVTVNGTEVASTFPGSGTMFAVSASQVTYTATDTDEVDLCAETTSSSGTETTCFDTLTTQVPPQEVLDLATTMAELFAGIYRPVGDALPCGGVTGNCGTGGSCAVNTGTCSGDCFVNTGDCQSGATCFINTGTCEPGGSCFVNVGVCRAKVDPR